MEAYFSFLASLMRGLASAAPAIAMLAVFGLAIGGVRMLRHNRQKGVLMLVCAAVVLGNVVIWTV